MRDALIKQYAAPSQLLLDQGARRRHANFLQVVAGRHFSVMTPLWQPALHQQGSAQHKLQNQVTACTL